MDQARPTLSRAIIASLALYALLLQPFLVAATPSVAGDGWICHASGDPTPGGPGDPHPCCAAACAFSAAGGPTLPPGGPAVWPRRPPLRLTWRVGDPLLPTGRPSFAASARGPPRI